MEIAGAEWLMQQNMKAQAEREFAAQEAYERSEAIRIWQQQEQQQQQALPRLDRKRGGELTESLMLKRLRPGSRYQTVDNSSSFHSSGIPAASSGGTGGIGGPVDMSSIRETPTVSNPAFLPSAQDIIEAELPNPGQEAEMLQQQQGEETEVPPPSTQEEDKDVTLEKIKVAAQEREKDKQRQHEAEERERRLQVEREERQAKAEEEDKPQLNSKLGLFMFVTTTWKSIRRHQPQLTSKLGLFMFVTTT